MRALTRSGLRDGALAVAAAALVVVAMVRIGPATGDFANYWTASALWLEGVSLDTAYDYRWFTEHAARVGFEDRLVGFAVLTPPSALLAVPFVGFGPLGGAWVYLAVQAALAVAVAVVGARAARLPAWVGLAAWAALWPSLAAHVGQGQFHLPVALALALGFLWLRDHPVAAGVAWGLAIGVKLYAWPVLVALLILRRWRAVGAVAGTLAAGLVVSVAALGWPVHEVWLTEILPKAAAGLFVDPFALGKQSLDAVLRTLFERHPGLNPSPWLDAPWIARAGASLAQVGIVGLSAAAVWVRRTDASAAPLVVALAAIASMPGGPLLASYQFVALAPTLLIATGFLLRGGRRWTVAALWCLSAAAVWVPAMPALPPLGTPRLVFLWALWAVLFAACVGGRSLWRPVAVVAGIAGAVALVAVARAPVVSSGSRDHPFFPLIAADLVQSPDGALWFSGLTPDRGGAPGRGWVGYRWHPDDPGPSIVASDPEEHVWAPTVTLQGVRWVYGPHTPAAPPGPVVSRDGDLYWAEGASLRSGPAWDAYPVWDGDRGRVWFLSDEGVGTRALRLRFIEVEPD